MLIIITPSRVASTPEKNPKQTNNQKRHQSLNLRMWTILFGSLMNTLSTEGSKFDFACTGIGFFGDGTDCSVYYICTGIGKAGSPMKCPDDTAWNQVRLACEWKRVLPDNICSQKKETRREIEGEITMNPEVEVFNPFLPTVEASSTKGHHRYTTKKATISARTSAGPTTIHQSSNYVDKSSQFKVDLMESVKKVVEGTKVVLSLILIISF